MTKFPYTRKRRRYLLPIIIVCTFFIWILKPFNNHVDLNNNCYYIAHAAGAIDGHTYTNSKEALLQSISRQYQYIEFDLRMTKDSILVCSHDPIEAMSSQQFLSRKINGHYTPLMLSEVLEIKKNKPFSLVTDITDNPNILNKYFLNNRKNVSVEAFSWQRWAALDEQGYTAMMNMNNKSLFHYLYYCIRCKRIIKWITASSDSYDDILRLRILKRLFGVKVAFFLLDKQASDFKNHIGQEIDLIYVDDKSELQSKKH